MDANKTRVTKKTPDTIQRDGQLTTQEADLSSPKETIEETVFNTKGKDNTDAMSFR